MQAHIYIEVDSATLKETDKRYAYVLAVEDKIQTAAGTGTLKGTYNRAVLTAIAHAVSRLSHPYEVHIHCKNTIAANMLQNLKKWAGEGFLRKDGEPVANRAELEHIWKKAKGCTFMADSGSHSYQEWLKWEIDRKNRENSA